MTDAAPARIVVIGEALVDIVHRVGGAVDEAPGGSPANVALTLGRLGRRPTLITRWGDDDRGERLRAWLAASDVSVDVVLARRTSTALARLDASGAAEYAFDIDFDLGPDSSHRAELVALADVVHIGSIAAVLQPGADTVLAWVRSARERALITYDPNIRPGLIQDTDAVRTRVLELVALADVVKVSDEDLRWLAPDRDPLDVARGWQADGPGIIVVTFGADGAQAVTPVGTIRVSAVATSVVDTVGAGDTFMGVLIDGLAGEGVDRESVAALGLDDLDAVLRRSAIAAAITVSRPGADPPVRSALASAAG